MDTQVLENSTYNFGMNLVAISYNYGKSILEGDNLTLEQTVWNDVVGLAY